MVRSIPRDAWSSANRLARSSSSAASTVSSNGELKRLSAGARPYPPIHSRYSAADMPSGMSALTAV